MLASADPALSESLLSARDVVVRYGTAAPAVDGVSFALGEGETLGVVGESGCGKSSLVRALLGLTPLHAGEVAFAGRRLDGLPERALRAVRPDLQVVFQDPISSLNPRRTVRELVCQPLRVWPDRAGPGGPEASVVEMLEAVGIDPVALGDRRPRELSGGQAQRVAIARALVLRPRVLLCDEPVSALDVSVQAQVLDLLARLSESLRLAMLFVTHDLAVVRSISDRVMVMYGGRVCEVLDAGGLLTSEHPYTTRLLASVPALDAAPADAPVQPRP
jgi:peptide/nickel transport system ATP-binding protein